MAHCFWILLAAAKFRRIPLAAVVVLSVIESIATCKAISLEREVGLIPDHWSSPKKFARAADGGFLVGIDSQVPTIFKLDSRGKTEWSFEIRDVTTKGIEFAMLGADHGDGVLVCLMRHSLSPGQEQLPGLLIRLDSAGNETGRLDPVKNPMVGGPFFYAASCAPWGAGYLLLAQERRPMGEAGDPIPGFGQSWPFRSVVFRLDSTLSVAWRKPLIVVGEPGNWNPPQTRQNGDMVIPGNTKIARLDASGAIQAKAEFPICTTLHTMERSIRLRFACAAGELHQATITEYDDSLHVVDQLSLGRENAGLPLAAEMSNGKFAVVGSHGHYKCDVQVYSNSGKPLDRFTFPQQSSTCYLAVAGPSEIAVLRDVISDSSRSIVSWLKID